MKYKSKILKLKRKQNRLKFWHNWGGYFFAFNALVSVALVPINALFMATTLSTILVSAYLTMSIGLLGGHDVYGKDILLNKKQETEQDILQLVKTDDAELEILKEADKIDTLQKEINAKKQEQKEQRKLIKELIKKKNLAAAAQQDYVKELTKNKIKNARSEAEQEVENLTVMPEVSEGNIID